ncbi:LANO_0F14950g1_1 [Lachancea nothofagi CBS 11611]|uniref:LANO_0F14950g1_1 n=1 Tax=Lachancea nothofagi CBS 11611 TaxID=1266666 RepID=A0A1G4KCF2_9SACH|nr:LANO_0F14950g1_1 [Lachancea nothofagi CBS 11611]
MSIRPVVLEDFPETSFEDIETTVSPVNWPKPYKSHQSSPLKEGGGAPSTASSESTTFSNNKKRYSTHTESDEEGSAFLDDFEEFRGKGTTDDLVQTHFAQREEEDGSPFDERLEDRDELDTLTKRFENKVDLKSRNLSGISRPKPTLSRSFKQPQSMLNLRERTGKQIPSSNRPHELTNSRSATSLRPGSRLGSRGIQYKNSMPVLSRYDIIREENEHENYNDEFEDDLKFDKGLLQPQFLTEDDLKSPLNLSPSQYTITADDSLLTPQLHKRHREWIKPSQLNMFREPLRHNKPSTTKLNNTKKLSVNHRLKTIKQEIDHNTPMKKGRMIYNPETLSWEGNEKALSKFRDVDSYDKKAIIIQGKPDLKPPREKKSSSKLGAKQHGKVVGRMMFDQENLCWIRIDGDEKDPFKEIPDFIPPSNVQSGYPMKGLSSKRSQSQFGPNRQSLSGRFSSSATTRYHSLSTGPSSHDSTFNIDSKTLEKFYHEENKWSRKVGGWFILRDAEMDEYDNEQGLPDPKSNGYMYEIRNMVISSARN